MELCINLISFSMFHTLQLIILKSLCLKIMKLKLVRSIKLPYLIAKIVSAHINANKRTYVYTIIYVCMSVQTLCLCA